MRTQQKTGVLENHLNAVIVKGRDRVVHHVTTEREGVMNRFSQNGFLNIKRGIKRPLRSNQFTESENTNHENKQEKSKQNRMRRKVR